MRNIRNSSLDENSQEEMFVDEGMDIEKNKVMLNKLLNFDDVEEQEHEKEQIQEVQDSKMENIIPDVFTECKSVGKIESKTKQEEHDYVQALAKEITEELQNEAHLENIDVDNAEIDSKLKEEINKIEKEAMAQYMEDKPKRSGRAARKENVNSPKKKAKQPKQVNDEDEHYIEEYKKDNTSEEKICMGIIIIVALMIIAAIIYFTYTNITTEKNNIVQRIKTVFIK